MNPDETNSLIDELLDGVISERDLVRLQTELCENSTALDAYYERIRLHNALYLEVGQLADAPDAAKPSEEEQHALDALRVDGIWHHLIKGIKDAEKDVFFLGLTFHSSAGFLPAYIQEGVNSGKSFRLIMIENEPRTMAAAAFRMPQTRRDDPSSRIRQVEARTTLIREALSAVRCDSCPGSLELREVPYIPANSVYAFDPKDDGILYVRDTPFRVRREDREWSVVRRQADATRFDYYSRQLEELWDAGKTVNPADYR